MYEYEGLHNFLYTMIYGAAAMAAIMAALYLLFRPTNIFSSNVTPPKELRYWAAAFLFSSAASHVWWTFVGTSFLADDRIVRNIINLMLDRLTFMPLMLVVLLRMLQDRRRPIWPIGVSLIPIVVIAIWGIANSDSRAEYLMEHYMRLVCFCFIIYYVWAIWKYNRWLRDNFADLQHKEVWQSVLFIACVLFVYSAYTVLFFVGMTSEFLAQVNTFIIVGFILWRVETLQALEEYPSSELEIESSEDVKPAAASTSYVPDNIGALLKERCEDTQLYLQHDLTLAQLALTIGTNRTYLSSYFARQNITYNDYINRLRVDYCIRFYRDTPAAFRPSTAQEMGQLCGYRSYSTFAAVFKKHIGTNYTTWAKQENFAPSTQSPE